MGLFSRSRGDSPPAPRGRRKRRLLGALAAAVLLVALAPLLIAHTPLRNRLIAWALPQLQGSVRVGGASLGWFRTPVLTDVEVRDSAGRLLLSAPRVEGSKSLFALACRPFDLGCFRVTRPAVTVVCAGDTTNLETMLAYWLQGESPPGPGPALKGVAFRAEVSQASLALEDADTGRRWAVEALDIVLEVPRDRRTPARLTVGATVTDDRGTGTLKADLSARLAESPGGPPRLRAAGELHADGLPLDAVGPLLRRLQPQTRIDGRLRADLRLQGGDGQPGTPDVRLEGTVAVRALELADPLLGPDVLRLQSVEAPCRLALDGRRLAVEQLDVRTDVGKAGFVGTLELGQELRTAFSQPGARADAELDLARLAALLPNTLHQTKDTRLVSGLLTLHLRNALRGEALLWEGDLRTSDLEGMYEGQRVTWKEPLAVVFAARQEVSAPLPVFERFRCDSDFLRLDMSGSLEEWTARGSFNLGKLSEHLAGFVDLGPLRLGGEGTLAAAARRNPRGGQRLEGDVRLARMNLTDGLRSWREDSLSLHVDLVGERAGGWRVSAGGLHLSAGADGIDLDLLEPVADLPAPASVRARLHVHGELARWHGRLASVTGLLNGARTSGRVELDGRLRYRAEEVQLEDVKVVGHDVRWQGMGLNVDEPALDFTTSGRWLPAREALELQHTRLSCPTLTAQAPAVTLTGHPTGAWQVTAAATVQGDVARLRRCVLAGPDTLNGALAGRVDLRPDDGRQVVQADLNVQNLLLGPPAAPAWREPRVHLTAHAVYDLLKDSLDVVQLHLDGAALDCDASGRLTALSSDMELSLEGKLGCDLEKLEPQLRPYLGPGVKLSGRDNRPFRLSGPLCGPDGAPPLLARLGGEAGAGWQVLEALGCQVGPAVLTGRLSGGSFRATPVEAALNQGRLRLEPTVRLEPGPMELTLPKGRVVEHARLTPAACASALGYAVPALANALQAEGEVSLELDAARVPLADPKTGDVSGRVVLHSAQVGGGPLARELAVLLKGPPTLTLAKENVVLFRMVNGRVYHTGLELHFPELTVRTAGSVGLDGSLALVAEMPVPPKWLGNGRLARAAAGQTIRLPVGGTLSSPKLDQQALRNALARFAHDTAENAVRQEIDGKLKQEAENGLKKLFRRK